MVRIRDTGGNVLGGGIVLGADYVLTCAHVIASACDHVPGLGSDAPATEVIVDSPNGSRHSEVRAAVEDGAWIPPLEDERGDLALLRLRRRLSEGYSARLRRISRTQGRAVQVLGYPRGLEAHGVWAGAELAGRVGPEGEWVQMNARPHGPRVRRGFSGSAVVDAEDSLGEVFGMVVGEYRDEAAPLSYMIPVETIIKHVPRVGEWVIGLPVPRPGGAADVRRVRDRLVDRTRGGVMILTSGDDRSSVSIARRMREDGAQAECDIDLELDATGLTVDQVAGRIAEGMGIRVDQSADPVRAVVKAVAAMSLLVDQVDAAADPDDLVRRLLGPLSERAVMRGVWLLVGFGRADASTQLRVGLLYPQVTRMRAIDDVNRWRRTEVAIAEPGPPPDVGVLRVRLTQLRAEGQDIGAGVEELERDVDKAMRTVVMSWHLLREGLALRDELRGRLDAYKAYAGRAGLAEDPVVCERYREAYAALWEEAPCDVGSAAELVDLYIQAIRGEGGPGEAGP